MAKTPAQPSPIAPDPAPATIAFPPAPSRNPQNSECLAMAHQRLDQIFNDMESTKRYGDAGVEVGFVAGVAERIHHTMSGWDRPAR